MSAEVEKQTPTFYLDGNIDTNDYDAYLCKSFAEILSQKLSTKVYEYTQECGEATETNSTVRTQSDI